MYLDDDCCEALVGEKAKTVLEISKYENAMDSNVCDEFWTYSSANRGKLLIIAIPYKEGQHVATKPTDFIPVMDQLQKLHSFGYAHGDIRAFNVVFCGDDGGLIDFDFSGKPENNKAYPRGYKRSLEDGSRIGDPTVREYSKLAFWHDWYALGELIFTIFRLLPQSNEQQSKDLSGRGDKLMLCRHKWGCLIPNERRIPTNDEIRKLKSLLVDLACQNWTVWPCGTFCQELEKISRANRNET